MTTTLRGIFLTSENPERTAAFYREVAGVPLEQIGTAGKFIYWKHDRNGIQLAIHDAGSFASYTLPAVVNSNVTHLYFKIENQAAFLTHLARFKLTPVAQDDVVVTVTDPDGRQVMFGTA